MIRLIRTFKTLLFCSCQFLGRLKIREYYLLTFGVFLSWVPTNGLRAQVFKQRGKLKVTSSAMWCLSDSISEISGISGLPFNQWGSQLIGIQDGGNGSEIWVGDWENRRFYAWQTGLLNRDWEAITVDSHSVYIGEFGNNRGNRQNLKVYRFGNNHSSLLGQSWSSSMQDGRLRLDSIEFRFEDQQDFSPRFRHNFDCESMLVRGDTVWLFSKNWKNFKSHVYVLLNQPGFQIAKRVGVLNVRCLITDACWAGNRALFVGYSVFGNQYVLEVDMSENRIVKRNKIDLKPGQIEGVFYDNRSHRIFVSTEKRKSQPAAVIELFGN